MTDVLNAPTINIHTRCTDPIAKALSYYSVGPKQTPDGLKFHMYAGFYYYIITTGDNRRFLRAKTLEELEVKRQFNWGNVMGLESILAGCLQHNLEQAPLAVEMIRQHRGKIIWDEPQRELRNAEKRWLRVVQNVVARLRD